MRYTIAAILATVVLAVGITWGVRECNYQQQKHYAPKEEQVRHDTFKQSQAYNDGVLEQLHKAQLDYAKAKTQEEKLAIGSYTLHIVSSYDETQLPDDLRQFLNQLRTEQIGGVK